MPLSNCVLPTPDLSYDASKHVFTQAKGKPAKGHPVVRRLLSLRALLADMSTLDDKMSFQVEILLRALASGVDLAGAGDSDEEEEEESDGESDSKQDKGGDAQNGGDGLVGEDSGEDVDEEGLEEEEARFMGNASESSSEEDVEKLSPSAAKKQRRAARKKALAEAKAAAAAGGGTGEPSVDDFGDEDMDEASGANIQGGGGGGNLLQGMVNRISQREKASTGKRRGLEGDLDVPVRERDQTIRVRRPVPGEGEDEMENSDGGEGSDDDDDDLGLGGDGFLSGLPPEVLKGLSRRQGAGDGKKKKKGKEGKRGRDGDEEGGGADGKEGGEVENEFYATVADAKERKKRAKKEKYHPEARIAGALEAELEAERAARGETKRGASYTIIKNRGLTPHKNKLNRNPRSKKREAFRKATIRRKGQVRKLEKWPVNTHHLIFV